MKQIIALTLSLIMLTACSRSFVGSRAVNPSGMRLVKTTMQTPLPPSIPTHMLNPGTLASATAAPFADQVSIEHAQIVYYDVTGSTAKELRASMDEMGPRDSSDGNRPVDASVDWYISWNWPGYGTEECDLSAANITYNIKVMMPRWEVPAGAPPELISKWSQYVQALALHEQGHVNIIVENYLSVKAAIQGATCTTAEAAAQRTLDTLRELNSSYDRETKHGATQGVIFP